MAGAALISCEGAEEKLISALSNGVKVLNICAGVRILSLHCRYNDGSPNPIAPSHFPTHSRTSSHASASLGLFCLRMCAGLRNKGKFKYLDIFLLQCTLVWRYWWLTTKLSRSLFKHLQWADSIYFTFRCEDLQETQRQQRISISGHVWILNVVLEILNYISPPFPYSSFDHFHKRHSKRFQHLDVSSMYFWRQWCLPSVFLCSSSNICNRPRFMVVIL